MSEPPSQSPPQTSNVFVDRPCLKCGYNLRGQTATWNRRALNWQVTCPECGGAQVVVIGSAERDRGQPPFLSLALALVGGLIAWQLISWLSVAQAAMMEVPTAVFNMTNTAAAARRAAMIAAGSTTALDGEWTTLAIHVVIRAVPVILSTMSFGTLLALAPYGLPRQRDLLLVVFVGGGCLFGAYLNMTGTSLDMSATLARVQLAQMVGTASSGVLMLYDWKWRLISGTIGVVLAVMGGRIGLAVGRPLGRIVAGMYVRIDS